jgi:hypothetical protein
MTVGVMAARFSHFPYADIDIVTSLYHREQSRSYRANCLGSSALPQA